MYLACEKSAVIKINQQEMNKVILMGRLTKNPEIKYAGKDNDMAVARYTLAVNRRYKRDGEQERVRRKHPKQIRMDSWKHQIVRFHLINSE